MAQCLLDAFYFLREKGAFIEIIQTFFALYFESFKLTHVIFPITGILENLKAFTNGSQGTNILRDARVNSKPFE